MPSQKQLELIEKYNYIRQSLIEYENLRRNLEPEVIDICEERYKELGSHTVFTLPSGILQLKYKKGLSHQGTSEGDLQSLDELIDIEVEKAKLKNKDEIERLESMIESLNDRLQNLKITEKGIELKIERDILIKKITKPIGFLAYKIV